MIKLLSIKTRDWPWSNRRLQGAVAFSASFPAVHGMDRDAKVVRYLLVLMLTTLYPFQGGETTLLKLRT